MGTTLQKQPRALTEFYPKETIEATKAVIDALARIPTEREEVVQTHDEDGHPTTKVLTVADDPVNLRKLPQNKAGDVRGYWDPSTIKDEHTPPTLIELDYAEGFPTVNGCPWWERMENEPYPLYEAFKTYRDMIHETARSLQGAAELLKTDVRDLTTLATLFYWQYRATAYDKFRRVKEDIETRKAVAEMEDRHGAMAQKLIDKVSEALEDMEPEELTPQMMIEWTKSAVALERVSKKMDPSKPQLVPGNPPSAPGQGGSPIQIGANNGTVQVQLVYTDEWRSS